MSIPIAVDAMGGDRAPREVVRGAIQACRDLGDVRIRLVGDESAVRRELVEAGWDGDAIDVVHAAEVIGMGESPVDALRKKRDSSIARAVGLVRGGHASAFVSAGNTGACVAAATLGLRLLPTIRKAGIAVAFYAGAHPVIVIDVGANVEAKPEHLVQYGVMASIYATQVLGVGRPRVGLLNVGEEGAKGNRLAKDSHEMFREVDVSFIGNVEGNEIFHGACDVVVCDGFTGNIVLKVAEGLAERIIALFKGIVSEIINDFSSLVPQALGGDASRLRDPLKALKERLDYSEFGGAPLLGVNGNVIIAHGRSDAKAIANAIRVARRMVDVDVNRLIVETIQGTRTAS